MTEVAALEGRVTRLETQISEGFNRIENMLQREISDLKTDQISDLKKANERIADDQRRAWDAIESLRRREDQRFGGERKLGSISHFLAGGFGAAITWVGTWLASGRAPHP